MTDVTTEDAGSGGPPPYDAPAVGRVASRVQIDDVELVGSHYERELVNVMDAMGYEVIRVPTSGGGTERELPDLIAGKRGDVYVIEAKYRSTSTIYLSSEEIAALEKFADKFGAYPLIGVRFRLEHGDPAYGNDDRSGWYVLPVKTLYQTDGGNYRVKKETALDQGTPIEQI